MSTLGPQELESLFRQHYAAMVLYGVKFLREREEAKEIVQEIFIALFEKRSELVIQSNPKSYLFQAVRNRCLNKLATMKTEQERKMVYREKSPSSYAFSDPLEAAEFEARLFQLIEGLPPACQSVFRMSRFDGKSNAEIAANLEISKRTVETHISKALRLLRKALYGGETNSTLTSVLRSFLL